MTRGYGKIAASRLFGGTGARLRATAVAWLLFTGELVPSSIYLCHECDNPSCVNPAHLFKGDGLLNRLDAMSKGRIKPRPYPCGESVLTSKMTTHQVIEIRQRHAKGEPLGSLSRAFGISGPSVGDIVHRKTWTSVL